jgi:hypothetical protein
VKNTFLEVVSVNPDDEEEDFTACSSAPLCSYASSLASEASTVEPPDDAEEALMSTGQKTTSKLRPCKGKRERHNRFVARLMKQIDSDPANFDFDCIIWPPTLFEDDASKKKAVETLLAHKTMTEEKLLSSGSGADRRGSIALPPTQCTQKASRDRNRRRSV